jgi:phenylalanyl-tRNA synthetase beta chain
MPVINIDQEDLVELSGGNLDMEEFKERIPMIGATVEKEEDGEIALEFFPDRPDLFSVEGVARAYLQLTGRDAKCPFSDHVVKGDSGISLTVDPGVKGIRPVIGGAFIRGVKIDEKTLKSIMNLQEKLHITVGRKRRKVAIGIHDAKPLKPPFRYVAMEPGEISFVPLQKEEPWNLERILDEHEKGTAYSWILDGMNRYPVILDSSDQVLSFPPIINGELTKVTEKTEDIFVDCTGWDLKAVSLAVNIVCSQLVERGGIIEKVDIIYPEEESFTNLGLKTGSWPSYDWKGETVDRDWLNGWLGKELTDVEIIGSLKRTGYSEIETGKDIIRCQVPPWRGDILHPCDIAEDIAIGFGFDSFEGTVSSASTLGSERRLTTISRYIRQTMIGQGFLEVKTISLSNERVQFDLMGREEMEHLKLTNPITIDHTMVRMSVIPTLMALLKANKHRDLPQRLFEIGDVMVENRNINVLAGVSEDTRASFTEVKGYVQRLLQDLDIAFILEPSDAGCYIKGRSAAIMVEMPDGLDAGKGPFPELEGGVMRPLGHFGEVHPSIISENELTTPVSAFEMDIGILIDLIKGI